MPRKLVIEILQLKAQLRSAYDAKEAGSWEYNNATYPRADWKTDIDNDGTQLGYFDWVIHKLESELN